MISLSLSVYFRYEHTRVLQVSLLLLAGDHSALFVYILVKFIKIHFAKKTNITGK